MIQAQAAPEQKSMPERKVVTILSCRVAGIENEAAAMALPAFLSQAVTTLEVMGGAVNVDAPRSISARFGSPEMSETDAERAVLAALELISVKQDNGRFSSLNLRIGISSGLIWMRSPEISPGRGEDFSSAVALQAFGLRDLSSLDTILITEGTRDFVKGLFEYQGGQPIILRNFSEPVRAFAVARQSETENRFEALRSQRTRFLGREREMALLANLWRMARGGASLRRFSSPEGKAWESHASPANSIGSLRPCQPRG